jgi:hypothetical protein
MKLTVGFGLASLLLATASSSDAHSVATHRQITRIAVEYLTRQEPSLGCAADLNSSLQIGTAAEDDAPRFMFHFLPRLDSGFFSADCDSLRWGFSHAACSERLSGSTYSNSHTWNDAVSNARDPNTGARRENGWIDLGYVLHLLQDLTSPAHTRNDAHPPFGGLGDPLEAVDRIPRTPTGQLLDFTNSEGAFVSLQAWTQSNFFSKDTVFDLSLRGPRMTSEDDDYYYGSCLLGADPACKDGKRKIAYKGRRYQLGRRSQYATVDDVIADEQFTELGPMAVLYAASFLRKYIQVASPAIRGCSP